MYIKEDEESDLLKLPPLPSIHPMSKIQTFEDLDE